MQDCHKIHLSQLSAVGAARWSVYFDIPVNGWAVLTVFLLTFSIYQDNRLTDTPLCSIRQP